MLAAPLHAALLAPRPDARRTPSSSVFSKSRGGGGGRSGGRSGGPVRTVAAIASPMPNDVGGNSNGTPSNTSSGNNTSGMGRPRSRVRAENFRHPLDQQNTQILSRIPGLSDITKSLVSPVAEQMLIMEQISTAVLVGPKQLPRIHQLVLEAAEILNIPPPQLYIKQNPSPNAFTLAISGREPVVVVHTALIELMTEAELQAVIAHELGHLKCDHGVWLTVANLLTLGVEILPFAPSFVAANFQDNLMRWVRAAELTCDRAALLVAGDPKVVVSVLMKLSGGCPKLAGELNVDAFLDQARGYDEASKSPLGWYLRNAQTRQLTHPLPVARAREIDEWSRSSEFRALVDSGMTRRRPAAAGLEGIGGGGAR